MDSTISLGGCKKVEETLKLILNKLDVLQTDVNGLKTDVNELKTDVNELKDDVGNLKTGQAAIKAELAEFKTFTKENFENLINQVDLTATHVFRHTKKLEDISTDLEFLKHKDYESQKEIFFLKERLRVDRKSVV